MKKIIIVDDDWSVLTAIQRGLNAHGFSTEAFESAKAFRDLPTSTRRPASSPI